eukprot:CAMPEP_0173326910 /NCGR_PEP_ID=MMETSP1144-20121109/1320_1 /TAXON_ID=483371 /ORGANISM="non described non described, Strain CCMP2298" /LENGTH=164 /DNA_ID=CAMNT_0014271257 /DNA_START=97 /DNA_END=588 /DNA_ORIENTATION=-
MSDVPGLLELTALRQQGLEDFFESGGQERGGPECYAHFSRDAALLSHPLFGLIREQPMERSLGSAMGQICNERLRVEDLKLSATDIGTRDSKYGLNCLSFDHEGALLASAGSNGVIRVYDFDHCCAALHAHRHKAGVTVESVTVEPVVAFDVRRDVASISWSRQ